jgi:hypothetical protein
MSAALVTAAVLSLSGCGESTKRSLGLTKQAPDEFSVVSRAPLSRPPDYALRPPRRGAQSPAEVTPAKQAESALLGSNSASGQSPAGRTGNAPLAAPQTPVTQTTPGESALLARAGADKVDSGVRAAIDRESAILAEADRNFIQRLLDYGGYEEPVVDAAAEARRLQQNEALGRPVNEGEVPTIERKERGLLEGVF